MFVTAPAGFGKTTAIRKILSLSEHPIFIPTPKDAVLAQFVQAFGQACTPRFPEMASPPHESVSDASDAESNVDIYTAWAKTNLSDARCTIAVDDLQRADGDPTIAMFLSRLADSTKAHANWLFCSRTRGHLPLTRWQAYGDADDPVNADDLRMTVEEAIALARSLNSSASETQIKAWVDQTLGFPVALAYAIRLSAR